MTIAANNCPTAQLTLSFAFTYSLKADMLSRPYVAYVKAKLYILTMKRFITYYLLATSIY